MRALFIPDDCGNGHRVRCEALAVELEVRGWSTYTIRPDDQVPHTHFDVVVLDLRTYRPPIPGIAKLVRIIDDPTAQGPCGLLVLASPGAGVETILTESAESLLVGPEYALLRREFMLERGRRRERVGIFDARDLAGWSAAEMAEQMASAQVVITYAGMRAMETACVGTPMVLIARNRGEWLNASGLTSAGAAVLATSAPGEAEKVAENVLAIVPMQERLGRAARELVDGLGCARVADAVEGLFR